jgi:hypothetical protein
MEMMVSYKEKTTKWQFYDQKFEYEQIIDPLETGWYGHVFFAYDLVRNKRPAKIVELGTAKGHSFFSFCQAVKDANLDTELFAVDTWEGDKHAGFYDNSVWDAVNQVKETSYKDLRASLLRKSFDEAANEFEEKSIDILHIDGCHTYAAVKNDFERWVGKVKDDGIVLFHDTNERQDDFGVYRLWDELKKQYETLEFDHSHGLGVLSKNTRGFSELFGSREAWQDYYCLKMDKTMENRKQNEEISSLKGQILHKDQEILLKDQEISSLKGQIKHKDQVIDSMITTKFWKLRSFCLKVRRLGRS